MGIKKTKFKIKRTSTLHKKMGKAPGTITYMGQRENTETQVKIINYAQESYDLVIPDSLEQIEATKDVSVTSWIDVIGISDESYIDTLGKLFGLNSLVLEDAVNPQQRSKIDEYDNYIFGVFKMLYLDQNQEIVSEHLAITLLESKVLVFQELKDDVFDGVRERVKASSGRIRTRGADYLFFALLDAVVDNYFLVLENINLKIEVLEEEVYDNPTSDVAKRIQELKKEVLRVRRHIFPMRELIGRLVDSESHLISKDTKIYLKDIQDHCVEINESLQIYREMSMSLMEMYMSNISNKMNEVMKVLTIMASIFIPLTFIAGVYGMNFDHMPELHYKHAYPIVWAVMITMFIVMLIYFKRKKWL
ncbi:magnesium/cobalt transporter CorA [Cellulophaga baltica]|uniref:magnesium/cobalt transporter CorA n=1 Tax=Cellulophaga TaxID=104264 RepID=UPI001C078044|nr:MULTISPECIES: magnesium/cobalt transporter CorA [Cellulophaga]MBU2996223.1 magnesium/cobalt transporter CorA [Cellulophaga baltica]MDO6767618.1 magnesium/cobalt transporter CorA [Cellulophaga sp. 1_MG-2023]